MKKLFKKFGLNGKEIDVFLKLLELGSQSVSILAKSCKIPRPTMYLILEKLKKKSMILEFEKFGIKYAKAVSPKDLFLVLERKKYEIEETRKILKNSIPELEKLENKLSITPKVRFYEGIKEVEKIYENIIQEKNKFYAFFNPEFVKKFMPKYYLKIPENIKKHDRKSQEILIDCNAAQEYFKKFNSKNHQIKIFPKNINFPSDTIITDEKIFMIAYDNNLNYISATEIWSKPLAQTQKVIFDELWDKYKKL